MSQLVGKFVKQSAEVLDYSVDFGPWFADPPRSDAPLSFTVTAEPGITIVGSARVDNVVSVVLAGGTDGQKYKITVRLTTTGAMVREADFQVTVKDV